MTWTIASRRLGAFVFVAALAGGFGARAEEPTAPDEPTTLAQSNMPPGAIPGARDDGGDSEAAALVLRLDRVEGELRRANGQIEELQNANRRLEDQFKRFREDVEFRLSHGSAPVGAGSEPPIVAAPVKPRKSDAFDPSADPNAAGAPKPLGATAASPPLGAPIAAKPPAPAGAPLDLSGRPTPTGPLAAGEPGPKVITSGVGFTDGPREQFNIAVDFYKAGQYAEAETQFKAFLSANPTHARAADAVFYLGETYLQRSRPREAAEQYLKLSTDYSKSSKAPEGLMRLGQSLEMLGNNEQACATFAEVGHRYPTASTTVKKTVEREMQSHHCT